MRRQIALSAGLAGLLLVWLVAASSAGAVDVQRGTQAEPAVHFDLSPRLGDMHAALVIRGQRAFPVRALPTRSSSGAATRALQTRYSNRAAPSTLLDFRGIGNGFSGPAGSFTVASAPSDPNAAVGLNDIFEIVNSDIAIFNKSGTAIYGPVSTNTLWSGFGGGCQTNNDGDGTVSYDRAADRWVIQQFSVSTTPYLDCVAVSQTSDPTGAYYRYSFSYGTTNFPDYPKLSVWPDAYYTTYNTFAGGSTFNGAEVCAFNRAAMLTGAAASQQCFTTSTAYGGVLAANVDSAMAPPAGSPEYVVGLGANLNSSLAQWLFHVDWSNSANSTFTGPTEFPVAAYSEACAGGTCIPQSGTTQQLDSLADRLMYPLGYRNFGTYESLVVDHSVTAGSSTGMRWYELRPNANHNLSAFQQGTYAPDSSYRWMGSIAEDGSGDLGMGFSVSSSSLHPEIHYTGRLATDPAGTMGQGEGTIINGAGSQTGQSLSRWGDYSSMAVDPSDDCTFYYTNQFIPSNGAFNWSTQIGSFKFPGCGSTASNDFSISANPTTVSVNAGSSGTSTISTAVTSGSAQTVALSVSGVPSGATASFNPTSVTAGQSSTLTINTGTAAAGTYTLTVTGTGTSATHTTSVTLTINPVVSNDFAISASPSTVTVTAGSAGTSTISTAVTSGSAQTVALSVSGVPSGATASFNPTSVTAGGSSTLTLNSGTAAAGSYTLTVTGTGTSATHATSVTLTINPVVSGGGIVNGGFETGTFSGWTTSGASTAVVSSGCHSGTYCARAGATSPTNGDSNLAQTFTVPTGDNLLSLYYDVVCPDTVTYDWALVTLRDNTAGTTSTILPKTCVSASGWIQRTSPVLPGHSYTLTLTSHDDNYAGDPTYTLFDDITLGATTPPPSGITNGGFETGTFSGWTTSGASTSIISSGCHSGTHCARAGSTSPTNGDSNIVQSFTASTGSTQLSLWYKSTCPDTITYDWTVATLKDNTTGTTASVITKACATTPWTQKTASITAGHSYTLTLTNHDDNYPADPTYTLFDDVTLQ